VEEIRRRVREGLIECPVCRAKLNLRGGYGRKIRGGGVGVEPRVVRCECPGCGTCHSIIASVMSPRSPYTQEIREKVVRELKRGKPRKQLSRELGICESTLRNWVKAFDTKQKSIAATMSALLVALREKPHGPFVEQVRRAAKALNLKLLCNLVFAQTNVLLSLAQWMGLGALSVSWL
jgi:transposase-like protein